MNKAIIYLRAASIEPKQKYDSIENQKAMCLRYAKKNGYTVNNKDIYCDKGFSGLSNKRPGLKKMITALSSVKNIKTVIVYDFARLYRDSIQLINLVRRLNKKGIEIITAMDGQLFSSILTAGARFWSAQHSKMIKRGLKMKKQRQNQNKQNKQ